MTGTVTYRTSELGTLPDSWQWTTLSEIGIVASGGTPKTREPSNFDGDIPWITPADLSGYTDKTIARGKRNISQDGLDSSSARLLPEGTVIFSSRAPVGYVVIAENPVSTNQGCKNLILGDSLFNEYVYCYLKGSKSLAESYASGTTFLELSAKAFGRLPIPIPPLNEQRRIVEKIEELFAKLDAGVQSLKQTQALLKGYRRSVLKAAVEGELSREWREAHRDELEPASELLDRILHERREKFTGKKYKEPASPDTSNLPTLPDRWEWTTVNALLVLGPQNGLYLPQSAYGTGNPILRIDDFQIGWSRPSSELRQVDASESVVEQYSIEAGDLLINRVNSMTHLGKSLVVKDRNLPALFESNMMRSRVTDLVSVDYLQTYLGSDTGRGRLIANAKQAVNQASINQSDVGDTSVPLASLEEQRYIVEEVERRLSVVDKLEATVGANLKRADALRQSILKRAFSGELIPQDPDDEPASVLLERIRAEREAAGKKSGKRRARRDDEAQGRLL